MRLEELCDNVKRVTGLSIKIEDMSLCLAPHYKFCKKLVILTPTNLNICNLWLASLDGYDWCIYNTSTTYINFCTI